MKSVITALHLTSLFCCILFHDLSSWFFSFHFMFYVFFFSLVIFCCLTPPLPHPFMSAGCKAAVELRWAGRALQRHQGEQAIWAFILVVLVCSPVECFDLSFSYKLAYKWWMSVQLTVLCVHLTLTNYRKSLNKMIWDIFYLTHINKPIRANTVVYQYDYI